MGQQQKEGKLLPQGRGSEYICLSRKASLFWVQVRIKDLFVELATLADQIV